MKRGENQMKFFITLFAFSLLIVFLSNFASAAIRTCSNCSNCTFEIGNATSGDVVQLNQSISIAGSCVNFTGRDNITFNCQTLSNFIKGSNSGTGISLNANSSNFSDASLNNKVINCNVTNFQYGIYLNTSNSSNISNSMAFSNTYGLYALSSYNLNVTNLTEYSTRTGPGPSTFHINQLNNGKWGEIFKSPFTIAYTTKNFTLNKISSNIKLRIFQNGSDFSGIDTISFEACGKNINPEYAKDLSTNENVLYDISSFDNNVITMEERIIEISWRMPLFCSKPINLSITANEYDKTNDFFKEPSGDGYINYKLTSKGEALQIDGKINEVDKIKEPLYSFFWQPGTGHPANYTYLYVSDDKNYLYLSADITSDNTNDSGNDWAKMLVRTISGEKEFKIDDFNSQWGKCSFGLTSKVPYKHVACEFKIPKNELPSSNEINFAFAYYGTSSPSVWGIYVSKSNNIQIINSSADRNPNGIGIYVLASNYSNFSGLTAYFNYWNGILFENSNNSLFTNLNVSENYGFGGGGLQMSNTYNNTVFNVTSYSLNHANGVGIFQGGYNNVSNILTFGNYPTIIDTTGFFINQQNDSVFYNITVLNHSGNAGAGFSIANGYRNNISNITASYDRYGVSINSGGRDNVFTNLTIFNNYFGGILLSHDVVNNTIKNSFIQGNAGSGLTFYGDGGAFPDGNLIYNNYFNNTAQSSSITDEINYYNTTRILGRNIVGGPYIGGNYWAAPNGTGFSQTCSSSTDGICNIIYSPDQRLYDYLPLTCIENWSCTSWQECRPDWSQIRSCGDANYCQTYQYKPAEFQACTYTGGGGLSPNPPLAQTFSSISSGGSAVMSVTNPTVSVTNITINAKQNISSASLTFQQNLANSTEINFKISTSRTGAVYQAFEITGINLNTTNMANATIQFRVNKTWVTDNGINASRLRLYRNPPNSTTWSRLTTTLIGQDANYYYYSAVTPGFSIFVVFLEQVECEVDNARCFENQVQLCDNGDWVTNQTCEFGCNNERCTTSFGNSIKNLFTGSIFYYILIGIVVLGVAMIIYFISKARRKS